MATMPDISFTLETAEPEFDGYDYAAAMQKFMDYANPYTIAYDGERMEQIINLNVIRMPGCKKVIFNESATIVLWDDGTKTVVKCQEYDEFSFEKGLLLCIAKKAYGNTGRFNDILREMMDKAYLQELPTRRVSLKDWINVPCQKKFTE